MKRHLAALAAASAVAIALAGCSSGTEGTATGPSTTTTGARAQQWSPNETSAAESTRPAATVPEHAPEQVAIVDRSDPAAVADAVVTTWFTWNTADDRGPNDAAARTGDLLTERFLGDVTGTTPTGSPGGQWLEWAAKDAQVWPTVSSVPNQGAVDTATAVHRMYQVEQTAIASDGSIVGVDTVIVAVLVVSRGGLWAVDDLKKL
ncbi:MULTISPECIES: hypothetical protein [Rhodococcus]|uniref:Lipoprotein n=1 Tax=Rhodococcus qingshengii JCM 15477 TaxID=1303681 RepID=A0AB38RNS0_RHOSG|nr:MULTISPECIES: hypothetical protein [Rhodococcus]MYV31785.1 hypothetical protein [Rhodococcus erythropolis]REK81727.1 hypothetical protein DVG80_20850 [Rhodococcus erythropolis]UPU46424.1 hypothetical protein M0639_30740 [Rhodococcus qingshengii JCM 15477]